MALEQIRVGQDNFSYVIYCERTKKAAIVDPGFDGSVPMKAVSDRGLSLEYIINTHHHGDHTSDNQKLKDATGARIVASKIESRRIGSGVDLEVENGDTLQIGDVEVKILLTPGHTEGGISLIVDSAFLITGDTMFIGDCGRCDLPGGDIKVMFTSLQRIKGLSDDLIVYPGHDYGPIPHDALGNQKRTNKVLMAKSLEELSKI
ncbi:MAG: MBL fold metallo-hydrolase [Thermoplasmata archaeon]|nr:MBL fold metallo-hydrolase [Thermoplasmata archaeon]